MTSARGPRLVYGRVYELFTDRPEDGPHPYVGQTTQTVAQRARSHRYAASVARDPWKAHIRPGPAGYRLLETVYASGDDRADQRMLDRAEAFWIDRLRPTYNDVRPVRPRVGDPLPPRPRPSRTPVRSRPRRRLPWRVSVFLVFAVMNVSVLGYLLAALRLPWPWVPWAVAPSLGALVAWRATMALLHMGRRLKAWR